MLCLAIAATNKPRGDRYLNLCVGILLSSATEAGHGFRNARRFYDKKRKIGKENVYLTENQVGRNEILCAEDDHSYMCHI